MAREYKSDGAKAVEQIFNTYFRRWNCKKELKKDKEGFRKAVMSDPNITKKDLVEFIKENAFTWSSNERIVCAVRNVGSDHMH